MNLLPGDGYVLEQEADGGRMVVPLPGWLVADNGELTPLAPVLGGVWYVRPRMEGDARCINVTAACMRRSATTTAGPFGPIRQPGRIEEA
ncbi:MAG: hypothetical protein WB765_18405 [Acidimicrobiales bacterium]|jgi:hypothetical protein